MFSPRTTKATHRKVRTNSSDGTMAIITQRHSPRCSSEGGDYTVSPTPSPKFHHGRPSTSPRSTTRRLFLNALVVCIFLTGLLLTFEMGGNMKRSLRMGMMMEEASQPQVAGTPYDEDFYHPFDEHYTLRHHCDVLPLKDGHNVWHDETSEAIRLHKHSTEICGPKLLIIGAMKCGTNTLGHLIEKHPRVVINKCPLGRTINDKETGCNDQSFQGRFDDLWEGNDMSFHKNLLQDPNSTEWLENWTHRLPWTDGKHNITIDKSPSYLNVLEFPEIAKEMKQLLPNAKIAVSVCDPALRLYSEYNHNMDQRPEGFLEFYKNKHGLDVPTDFTSFVNLQFMDPSSEVCLQYPRFCERNPIFYLKKGEYSTHIQGWREAFGQENVLVVDMHENQESVAHKLLDLVGHDVLPPDEYPWNEVKTKKEIDFKSAAANYTGRKSAYHEFPNEIVQLEQYYAAFNNDLAHMLGESFPLEWNRRLKEALVNARSRAKLKKKQKASEEKTESRRQRRSRERREQS